MLRSPLLRRLTLAALLSVAAAPAAAGELPVTFRVSAPASTPDDATVYIAGDFQGWRPGLADYALRPVGDGVHEITLDLAPGAPLQFKFTLGGWDRVEKGPRGEEIQNRLHRTAGADLVECAVASWANGAAPVSTRTGDIRDHAWPDVLGGRPVWVYLPPGYDDEPGRRYSVLYMLDGQNVFDAATSFAGEWRVDETLEELIPRGEVAPLIVVAVANGGDDRSWEYVPCADTGRGLRTGGASQHLDDILTQLAPRIDATYRTWRDPQHTGLAGSSFGGLMALHAGWTRPDVFGRIGAFSPSLGFGDRCVARRCAESPRPLIRLYVDMGTRERGNLQDADGNGRDDAVDDLRRLQADLGDRAFVEGRDLMVVEGEGHRHNESYWARRFPDAVRFLFPGDR